MKSYLKLLSVLLIGISLVTCQKENVDLPPNPEDDYQSQKDSVRNAWDSTTVVLRDDVIQNLKGKWAIESVDIEFQGTYANAQVGIEADTAIPDFGKITFGDWDLLTASSYPESTSYNNKAVLTYQNQEYSIEFDYLLYNAVEYQVFSFLDIIVDKNHKWDTTEGRFLSYLGIFDNIEIVKINQNEFHLIGLSHGVKKMKLIRM